MLIGSLCLMTSSSFLLVQPLFCLPGGCWPAWHVQLSGRGSGMLGLCFLQSSLLSGGHREGRWGATAQPGRLRYSVHYPHEAGTAIVHCCKHMQTFTLHEIFPRQHTWYTCLHCKYSLYVYNCVHTAFIYTTCTYHHNSTKLCWKFLLSLFSVSVS